MSHNEAIFLLIVRRIAVCEFASPGVMHPQMSVTGVPFVCVCLFFKCSWQGGNWLLQVSRLSGTQPEFLSAFLKWSWIAV